MSLSIESIKETLTNPDGRFRRLDTICPLSGPDGLPMFSVGGRFLKVPAIWKEVGYMMYISLRQDVATMVRAVGISRRVSAMSDYLPRYLFFDNEMTVYDQLDKAMQCYVILVENPPGTPLGSYLSSLCYKKEQKALLQLLDRFCDMARWLLDTNITHRRINLRDIKVCESGELKLLNFDYVDIGDNHNSNEDGRDIAMIAIYIKMLACYPELYDLRDNNSVSQIVGAIQCAVPVIENAADKKALASFLSGLPANESDFKPDFASSVPATLLRDSGAGFNLNLWNRRQYDNVEPQEEGLCCVELDGKFGFIDSEGMEAIPLRYDNATSFKEGRSVIVVNGEFGMIDKEGNEILEPRYESVDWYYEEGVAKISCEGKFGLTDRMGNEITPLIYDWIGEMNENMLSFRRNGLYGFLRGDGTVIVEPVYDDVEEFRNGVAAVVKNNTPLMINYLGDKISVPLMAESYGY